MFPTTAHKKFLFLDFPDTKNLVAQVCTTKKKAFAGGTPQILHFFFSGASV